MDTLLSVASAIFWGIITISVLVFVHEGGHFLAARICRVRVTEFYLGLPCSRNLHTKLPRTGTEIGVTPLLLGGYAAICGLDDADSAFAPAVLSAVHRKGVATPPEIARELGIDEQTAESACMQLMGWGSLAPVYDGCDRKSGKYYPDAYASMPRDAHGFTVYDGRAFDAPHATEQGEPWDPPMGERAFFEHERAQTYAGKGFWKRALMLAGGVIVNITFGIALLVSAYSIAGFDVAVNTNQIGSVTEGSPAQQAGMREGDRIVAVDGQPTEDWVAVVRAISDADSAASGDPIEIVYERDGQDSRAYVTPDDDGLIGINVSLDHVRLPLTESFAVSMDYLTQTVTDVAQLLVPSHTGEILENSTSIVGISVMSAQAASLGPASYLLLAGFISISLGLMNLLPIPPLDGGKLIIEIVQGISRRKVPARVKRILSYAGVALFLALFVYMLQQDITRMVL